MKDYIIIGVFCILASIALVVFGYRTSSQRYEHSYTVTNSDYGKTRTFISIFEVKVSLPPANELIDGFYWSLYNKGVNPVEIKSKASKINGSELPFVITNGRSALIMTDDKNYYLWSFNPFPEKAPKQNNK